MREARNNDGLVLFFFFYENDDHDHHQATASIDCIQGGCLESNLNFNKNSTITTPRKKKTIIIMYLTVFWNTCCAMMILDFSKKNSLRVNCFRSIFFQKKLTQVSQWFSGENNKTSMAGSIIGQTNHHHYNQKKIKQGCRP